MYRSGSFFIRLVGVLVLFGVLIGVGALAFRAGQAQGYALGLTVSGGETSIPPGRVPGLTPAGMPVYGYWGWPHAGIFPAPFLSLLCLFGLGLMFLFSLGAIFRPRHWHSGSRHSWHGGPPPWMKEKDTSPNAPDQADPPAARGQSQSSAEPG